MEREADVTQSVNILAVEDKMDKNWQGYITALGGQKPPASNIDQGMAFPNTEGGVPTGFVEWKPANPKQQARYDAMSSSWEGVQASESASASNIFKADYMPVQKK
jgi:hypothetical protein